MTEHPYDIRESRQVIQCDMDGHAVSLRDRYAMAALTGFQSFVSGGWAGIMPNETAKNIAQNCYTLADAMLEARRDI